MAHFEYGILPQWEEDAIHNVARLLSVESRPYQRITSRILKQDAPINSRPTQLATPPPDASAADEEAAARFAEQKAREEQRATWQQEVLLDVSLFEASIIRMELIHHSNDVERERYAAEKERILNTSESIKESISELRVDLEEAKQTLALRKTYDEQAEKISSNKVLKPRDEQQTALDKLDEEITELQQELLDYKRTWAERREQFGRIVEEGKQMLRMIKDEKEEAERKEGMMKDEEDGEDREGSTTRGDASAVGTPRPDIGNATPIHVTQDGDEDTASLKVPRDRLVPLSRGASRVASPAPSRSNRGDGADTEMADSGVNSGDAQANEESEMEEGEEEDDGPTEGMELA